MTNNMARLVHAAIYCRVSTEEQKQRQSPIDTQVAVCLAECDRVFGKGSYGSELYVDEGYSGTLPRKELDRGKGYRPEYSRMVHDIAAGNITHLVCQAVDRLGRSESEIGHLCDDLEDAGVLILTPGQQWDASNPEHHAFISMNTVWSAYQPRQTRVKVKQSLARRVRQGHLPTNKTLYGWRLQRPEEYPEGSKRHIEPVPEQGRWIRTIRDLYMRGWGSTKIMVYLNKHGAPSPGKHSLWTVANVRNVVFNCTHAGLVRLLDAGEDEPKLIQGKHFEKRYYQPADYDAIMERKKRASRRRFPGVSNSFFLSGTLRCSECERALVTVSSAPTRRYQCARGYKDGHLDCTGVSVRADAAEAAALAYVRSLVDTPQFQALARGEIEGLLAEDERDIEAKLAEIEKQRQNIERKLDWVIDQAANEPGLRARFEKTSATYTGQIAVIEEEARQLRGQVEHRGTRTRDAQKICDLLTRFDPVWETLAHDERREVVALLLESAIVSRGEGEVVVRLKAHFLPEEEARIPALQWQGRPAVGPMSLRPRECEALHLRSQGLTYRQIAQRWGTTISAPRVSVSNALRRLQVEALDDAMEMAGDYITRVVLSLAAERPTGGPRPREGLTPREQELLPWIVDTSLTYRAIARKLQVTDVTIRTHASNIARKLGVRGRRNIAEAARCAGIIPPQSPDEDAHPSDS